MGKSSEMFIYQKNDGSIGIKFSENENGQTLFETTLPADVCKLLSELIINPNLVNALLSYNKE